MKKLSRLLLALMLLLWCSSNPFAQTIRAVGSDGIYYLKGGDGHEDYTVDGSIVFKCVESGKKIPTGRDAGVCFSPAKEGDVIRITFEDIDLEGGNYLKLYHGYKKTGYPQPSGYFAQVDKDAKGKVFESESADGKFSISFHSSWSVGSQTGWSIKVETFTPEEMTYSDVLAEQGEISSSYPGKKQQALILVNVKTEGRSEPLTVDGLSFNLNGTTSLSDVDNLQVFYTGSIKELKDDVAFGVPVSSAAESLTMNGSQKLVSGNNYFWLVADINPDAKPMNKLDAQCTSVKIAGEEKLSEPLSPEGNINIDNIVLISSDPTTYKVGDDPISFYDDGGKEGNISENFHGQVTFIPTSSGKKVMIDFTKVVLFESSNKNEILKVYNGKEAKAENLIQQVMSGEIVVIHSTSADGALTVTLDGDTAYPKEGFEALVSEFSPKEMTVEGIVTTQYTEGTVSGGDIDQPILSFNIKTVDTEPALNATKFAFTTGGTFANVSKATLYATGKSSAFSTLKKVGEVNVGDNAFEINCGACAELMEGDNYFWLAYDIQSKVQSGDKIDAGMVSVTLSDGTHEVTDGNPAGDRTVENTYLSVIGKADKTVYGSWYYTHTTYIYGSSYEGTAGDQIVTFRPGTDGKIIELDFSQFSIRYYAYAGADPVFKVYSGTETTGTPLWIMTEADKDQGPGRILRSQSADGALTVVFNANGTAGNNKDNGWKAEVREYQSRPMSVDKVFAFQASTDILKSGAKNQEIIGFKIKTTGDQNPLSLNEVVLNLKGSQDKIGKVYVYTSGKDSVLVAENAIAEEVPVADSENMKLAFTTPLKLLEGSSYYWVAYDVLDDVEAEQNIDAALVSVKIGSDSYTPANGDPEGTRVTKSIYEMQNGNNVVNVTKSLMFYDNGGAENNYTTDVKGTVTFVPKEGEVIKMVFRKFYTNTMDDFFVYNGRETVTANQIAKYFGSKTGLPDLLSTAEDGSMTIKFEPTRDNLNDGWEIEVISYSPEPLSFGGVKAVAVNPASLMRGMKDEPMMRIEVEVKGEKGALTISQLNFDAGDAENTSSISAVNVYCTDTISNFATADKFAETMTAAPYVFDDTYEITVPGIYKFWLAYDIALDAKIDEDVKARFVNLLGNGVQVEPSETSIALATVKEGFKGTYTVGTSDKADYHTISEAVKAMEEGIDAPVVFELENGEYNEVVTIPHIPGSSELNTVTFKSKTGRYQDVTIYSNRYSEPSYSEDKMFHEYGVFTLAGADYVTLDGVTVTTTDLTFPSVVHIKNMSRHITVKNCHVYTEMSTSASGTGISLVYMYALSKANQNNDYFTLENCLLEGGWIGARIGGTSQVNPPLPYEKGARILNNTFRNQGSKGIYIASEGDSRISDNIIFNDRTTGSYNAMDLFRLYEGSVVNNNVMALDLPSISSPTVVAMYMRPVSGTAEKPIRIYNNEINFLNTKSTTYGLYFADVDCKYVDLANNTIRIGGAANASANNVCLYRKLNVGVTFTNNLLQNEVGGYVYRTNGNGYLNGAILSNNALYSSNMEAIAWDYNQKAMTLDQWKTYSGEKESFEEKAVFVSENILDLSVVGGLNKGIPLSFVTTDLNGNLRSSENPTIGAYEYNENPELPVMEEGYPVISRIAHESCSITVKASQSGKAFLMVKEVNEDEPSPEEMLSASSVDMRKGKEADMDVSGLANQTDYKLYVLLQDVRGNNSGVLTGGNFSTTFTPTEVSDFENVTLTGEGFEDGTASFSGFTVETISDGVGSNNSKAAKITAGTGVVTLTNSVKGLPLNGFFVKSDAEVMMTVHDAENNTRQKTIVPTAGKWIFSNLRDMGTIVSLNLESAGNTYIDNFSGQPQPITFMLDEKAVHEGETVTLSADVEGGVAPYIYEWRNAKQAVLSTDAVFAFAPQHIGEYALTVTDAWGITETQKTVVSVEGKAYTATFDDLYLDPESHWRGDEIEEGFATFYSGSYSFNNFLMKDYDTWAYFGYSNETSTGFSGLRDQFRSAVGSGANDSENYAVVYVMDAGLKLAVENNAEGDSIQGCYVTNTAWAKDAVLHGDGLSTVPGGFAKGDYFVLTAKGTKEDNSTVSVDFCLADYRSDNEADHYCLDTWEWMDLRPLGKVKEVTFSMNSTKYNKSGMTTPSYFCLDDFNGSRSISQETSQTVGLGESRMDLQSFFSFEQTDASIAYRLEDNYDHSVLAASVEGDQLMVDAVKEGTVSLIISAAQKGRRQFAKVDVTADASVVSIKDSHNDGLVLYPVPARDQLNVCTDMENYILEILSASGSEVMIRSNNSGNTTVRLNDLESGIYLLKIYNSEKTIVRKFSKMD